MKDVQEVTACVVDYGSFLSLAEKLGETMVKVYYYSPFEQEFLGVEKCVIGDGLEKVEREDEFLDPEALSTIDLFVFPDIGYKGLQRHLRDLGKAVWGSMGANDLEVYRTRFLKTIEELGLPMVNSVRCVGVTALSDHLKEVKNKWVKINRYRENMETWKHLDYEHSIPMLRKLATDFGGVADRVVFIVQDEIPDAQEIGYDGWSIDGWYPDVSTQGYELKNKLYLGSVLPYDELPESVRLVNEKMSPVLESYGYRNFVATEIREQDGTPYFIDPTLRMPGQTGEQLLESCVNLADVIWQGANGITIKPEFAAKFVAEATIHYSGGDGWRVLRVPEQVKRWTKLYHYCQDGGLYHFPPRKIDEVGVIIGMGDTIEEALTAVKENFEAFKDEPVRIEFDGFAELLKTIQEAEAAGLEFTDQKVPSPETVLE